jgi:D-alanyl-D-alanine carboxypeptidase
LWPAVAIALVSLVVVAVGPGGVAQATAGAIERVLGQTAFQGPLPACTIGDRAAPNATFDDWDRTLLDTEFTLDRDYAPTDLVAITESGVRGAGSVRALVVLDLEALGYAARKAGVELSVESAYRSYDAQRRTFDSLVDAYGRDFALESAGRPGHSEHQLGTTLDFARHDEWLADNAWRFGFVLSYPEDRSPRPNLLQARVVALPLFRSRSRRGNLRIRSEPARVAVGARRRGRLSGPAAAKADRGRGDPIRSGRDDQRGSAALERSTP